MPWLMMYLLCVSPDVSEDNYDSLLERDVELTWCYP